MFSVLKEAIVAVFDFVIRCLVVVNLKLSLKKVGDKEEEVVVCFGRRKRKHFSFLFRDRKR